MDTSALLSIAQTGRPLGALLYYSPASQELAGVLELLQASDAVCDWPFGTDSELRQIASLIQEGLSSPESLAMTIEAYKKIFVGPGHFESPPWGSVYLDKESVLFGDSTLRLRDWQRAVGIQLTIAEAGREPEDHIGLMLMLCSWLAENKPDCLEECLAEHLFPWAERFLELLQLNAKNSFYEGIARLSSLTLAGWKEETGVSAHKYKIYF